MELIEKKKGTKKRNILVYVVWEEEKKRVERSSPQYKSNHGTM
jgi:hypothetical protein